MMGNGQGVVISSIGSTHLSSPFKPHTSLVLSKLLLVPTITKNLVSVSKFAQDNGVFFEFHATHCLVKSQDNSEVLLRGSLGKDGLCCFDDFQPATCSPSTTPQSCSPSTLAVVVPSSINDLPSAVSSYELWHKRLGHANHEALKGVLSLCNIPLPNKTAFPFCSSCCLGKSHRLSSTASTTIYSAPLELVFADLWGPAAYESSCGFTYFLTCVDAFSRFTWIFLLKKKSETFSAFVQFKTMAELQFNASLKSVQTDGGT